MTATFGQQLSSVSQDMVDVVIIGGGLSGYTALDELNLHGLSVFMLEEKDRAGGNARTYTAPDGQLHPGGSTVLGLDGNDVMIKFLERIGLRPKAKNAINPGYLLTDDPRLGPGAHSFDLFKPGKSAQEREIAYSLNDAVEEMRRELNVGPNSNPFPVRRINDPNILALDDLSLLEYTRKKGFPQHVVEFVDTIARSDSGISGAEISALAGIMDHILYINNGNDFWIYPGGNFSIINEVLKRVAPSVQAGKVRIQNESRVVKIEETKEGAIVHYVYGPAEKVQTVKGRQVLLGVPPHRVSSITEVSPDDQSKLAVIKQSGPYAIVSLYVAQAALATHKFYIMNQNPEHRELWTTDFVQTSTEGDHQTPIGTELKSVITIYVPIPSEHQHDYPRDNALVEKIVGEITTKNRLPELKEHITGHLVTMYPEGIAYVAKGGVRKLASLNPRISPHVRLTHSSIGGGGIISAARGAIWEGLTGAQEAAEIILNREQANLKQVPVA